MERIICMRKKIIFIVIITMVLAAYANNYKGDKIQQSISTKILRFHVLANSDSEIDQEVKIKVRDAVGTYIQPYLSQSASLSQTKQIVQEHIQEIVEVAEKTVQESGYDYEVSAQLVNTDFPIKKYGSYTFPAGEYEALEITLGAGKGHNWWCVLYPNMCFKGTVYEIVEDSADEELREVLTSEEYESVFDSRKFEIRFKFLDIFNWNS